MLSLYIEIFFTVFFLFFAINATIHSQEDRDIEIVAQEILARVDRILDYPNGSIKGRMIHITPDGRSNIINLIGFITDEEYLFKFASKGRGEELKVLYTLSGEDIWVYHIHAVKLFNKRGVDKYDSILFTNYCYIDLSNADLQSNYTARITGDVIIKGHDAHRLELVPILRGGDYGLLTLYATKKDCIPLRIDYYDPDKVIFKTLSVVKVINSDNRIIPIRYDMLDIRRGTVTMLEFVDFEKDIKFDKKIFRYQNLWEE